MATTNPRITVTLTKRQHEVLRSISDTSGKSMSSFLCELIDGSMPMLERMAVTFQKIHKAQQMERQRYVQELDETQAAIEPIVQAAVGQFDLFMAKVEARADAVTDAARAAPARRPNARSAPSTNRGATPPQGKGRKPLQDKAGKPVSHAKLSRKKAS